MKKIIDYDTLGDILESTMGEDLMIPLVVSGNSMMPLFIDQMTIVQLVAPKTVKKGDVVLFRNASNRFVLHRVIKINKITNQVITRGDANVTSDEPLYISQIKAKVEGFYVKLRYIKMSSFQQISYYFFRTCFFIPRKIVRKLKQRIKRLF